MVTKFSPSKWCVPPCTQTQCLYGCGYFLFWLPRVSIPMSIVWGVFSHISYSQDLTNGFLRKASELVGSVAGILAFIAYFQIWYVGPGYTSDIPELARTDPEADIGLDPEGIPEFMKNCVEAKQDGGVRFCTKCNAFKPDRAHHCRQCGRCVLRMDHHCPWFSTCIGLNNHKMFVQFLWYVWILCMCADLVSIPTVISFFQNELYNTRFIGLNFVFYLMLSTVFNLTLLFFGSYTTYLMAMNRTTLESLEPNAYRTSLPANQWRFRHPPTRETVGNIYDIGIKNNVIQVMGHTWAEWLLPIRPKLDTNGITYPINETIRNRAEERAQTEIAMHQRKRQWNLAHNTPTAEL